MRKTRLKYGCILCLVFLTFGSAQNYDGPDESRLGKYSQNLPRTAFDKDYLIDSRTNPDSLKTQSKSNADSLKKGPHIKVGKIIGLATIGFLSGLFFGASTEEVGFFQGVPVFHLKPALIGAGIGVVASFLLPDKPKKPKKEDQDSESR